MQTLKRKTVYYKSETLEKAVEHLKKLIVNYFNLKHRHNVIVHCIFDIDDTLIFDVPDEPKGIENNLIIRLFHFAKSYGIRVHLVTARLDSKGVKKWTETQLKAHNIQCYDSLSLAPLVERKDLATVSSWKHSVREKLHSQSNNIVLFSVGDQWGDGKQLQSEEDILTQNKKFKVAKKSFQIHEGQGCVYFLKLTDDL